MCFSLESLIDSPIRTNKIPRFFHLLEQNPFKTASHCRQLRQSFAFNHQFSHNTAISWDELKQIDEIIFCLVSLSVIRRHCYKESGLITTGWSGVVKGAIKKHSCSPPLLTVFDDGLTQWELLNVNISVLFNT